MGADGPLISKTKGLNITEYGWSVSVDLRRRGNDHSVSWLRCPYSKHSLLSSVSVLRKNGLRLEVHAEQPGPYDSDLLEVAAVQVP